MGMTARRLLWGVVAVAAVLAVVCDGRQVKRGFRAHGKLAVLESFCFAPPENGQTPSLKMWGKGFHANQHLLAFDQEAWGEVSKARNTMDCHDQIKKATVRIDGLTPVWKDAPKDSAITITEAQYWFVVGLCCGEKCDQRGLDMEYKVELFNPSPSFPSRHFNREFPADQMGMVVIYGVFVFLLALVCGTHVFGLLIHRNSKARSHYTSKVVSLAFAVQFGVVFGKVLHLNLYGTTGTGSPTLDSLSDVGEAIFECLVIVIALMVASGWAFGEYPPSSSSSRVRHGVSVLALCVAYVACYAAMMGYRTVAHPMRYAFDSPFGVVVNVLRALLAVYVPWAVSRRLRTCQSEPRRQAYKVVAVVVPLWLLFLAGLLAIGGSVSAEDRPRYVVFVTLIANLLMLQGLVWLGWPTVASDVLSSFVPQHNEGDGVAIGRVDDGL